MNVSLHSAALQEKHAPVEIAMAKLLSPESWEEALAYWVDAVPATTLIRGLLPILLAVSEAGEKEVKEVVAEIRHCLEEPDDERRWRLFQLAESLGFATPAGALGLVLFWLGGSMTPANCEPVYADRALVPLMLQTACRLMAIKLAGDNPPETGAKLLFSRWLAAEREA